MATAYLGIGSNIGDKETNCREAVRCLKDINEIEVTGSSSFYVTRPVDGPPQEDYLNGVLKIETQSSPEELLHVLKGIENAMGRTPAGRNCPRIIDMDILFYDNVVMDTGSLIIPHPRMHERYFVLRGLFELVPYAVHPVLRKTVVELYREVLEKQYAAIRTMFLCR